jgi:F420-non-reducing hydrogenase iron-sulfur subunit
MGQWDPTITVLSCRYCGNIPIETAGALRIQYPSAVRVQQVPCTGTIGVGNLLKELENGADGVLIVACPEGNCHHLSGNGRAVKRVAYTKKLLTEAGLEAERLRLVQLGIGSGRAFAEAAGEMTARIRLLGPLFKGFEPAAMEPETVEEKR